MKETDKYQDSNSKPAHLDENELAQYADFLRNETGQLPERLVDHVATCSHCRAEIMAIADMLDTLPDMAGEAVQPPAGFTLPPAGSPRVTVLRWLRTAAAVAAMVALAWAVQKLMPDRPMHEPFATNTAKDSIPAGESRALDSSHPSQPSLSATGTSVSAMPDTIRYASAYVLNPVFESLVGAKYRGGIDPKVTGPDPGAVFAPGDTLKISWTPDPRDAYLISIVDNKANPLKEIKPGANPSLNWILDLKPGLYYWKFLGKEEIWKVGKFKIINPGTNL